MMRHAGINYCLILDNFGKKGGEVLAPNGFRKRLEQDKIVNVLLNAIFDLLASIKLFTAHIADQNCPFRISHNSSPLCQWLHTDDQPGS
jgi:hypothetical protein